MSPIRVEPIGTSKRELKPFLAFAWEIYRGNPYWVPPLIGDKIKFIRKGPYAEIGKIQPFVARRDGRIVGRLIAHFDRRHNEYFNEKRGCVGFFESIDDVAVSRALFAAAEKWLADQGMDCIHGPMNFIVYDESGLLADDYEAVPPIELGYNPPYYHDLFLDYGFQKSRDWYAYRFTQKMSEKVPKLIRQVRDRALNNTEGITFRNADHRIGSMRRWSGSRRSSIGPGRKTGAITRLPTARSPFSAASSNRSSRRGWSSSPNAGANRWAWPWPFRT